MKKHCNSDHITERNKIQEKILHLTDDLLTALEGHMEEIEMQELFYNALKFMTFTMYECLEDHRLSLKTLKIAMDHGIQMYMEKRNPHAEPQN